MRLSSRGMLRFARRPTNLFWILACIVAPAQPFARAAGSATPASEPAHVLPRVDVQAARDVQANSVSGKVYTVGKEIQSVAGSASDLLQNIPSVQVDFNGGISLRGSDNVTILIDGKPSAQTTGGRQGETLAQLPASSIERIEVITNPSARYASDGAAGIINIVLKRQNAPGLNGSFSANIGDSGRENGAWSLNYGGRRANVFAILSARHDARLRLSDEHRSSRQNSGGTISVVQHDNELSRPLSRRIQSGFDLSPSANDKWQGTVTYNGVSFTRDVTTTTIIADQAATTADFDHRRHDPETQLTAAADFRYRHAFPRQGEQLSVGARAERHEEHKHNFYTDLFRFPARPPERQYLGLEDIETSGHLTADYVQPWTKDGKFECGLAYDGQDFDVDNRGQNFDAALAAWITDPARTNRFIYRTGTAALYFQAKRKFKAVTASLGLRYEHTRAATDASSTHPGEVSAYERVHPSVQLSRPVNDTLQLQVNYGHRLRRPTSDDVNPFPDYHDPYNLRAGNPQLRPEETHSLEAGLDSHTNDVNWTTAAFFRHTLHAFTPVTTTLSPVAILTTQQNLGNARAYGVDLSWSRQVAPFNVTASATIYRSEIDASNLGLANTTANTTGDAKVSVELRTGKRDVWQLNANFSARRLTAQGYRLPASFVNLGWRHDVDKNLAFVATVSDVFNSLRDRVVIDTPTLHDVIERRRAMRVFFAGFVYTFGRPDKKSKTFEFDSSL